MNWADIGKIVGANAPLIGKAVSFGVGFIPGIGPIASTIVGPLVGNALAGAFGVAPTPEAVAGAITANGGPDSEVVKAKLAAVTEELKAKYAFMAEIEKGNLHLMEVQLEQTNESLRAELPVESPFKTWWRPFNGWVLGFENAALGLCLVAALIVAILGNPDPINVMKDAWPLILAVLGLPAAVVGVAVWQRGNEKIAATNAVASGNAVLETDPQAPSKQLPAPDQPKLPGLGLKTVLKPISIPRSAPDLSKVDPRERVQTG